MDQELIAYFDARFNGMSQQFAETNQRIADLRQEMNQRFEKVDQRFEQMEQRFEQIDQRFEQIDQRFEQIDQRFEQIDQRFEQIDQRFEQVDQRFEQVDQRFEQVEAAIRHTVVMLEGVRSEVHIVAEGFLGLNERVERYYQESRLSFEQVKGWIEPYFRNLDGRVRNLESWAERQQWGVLESIQKLLGKLPPKQQAG